MQVERHCDHQTEFYFVAENSIDEMLAFLFFFFNLFENPVSGLTRTGELRRNNAKFSYSEIARVFIPVWLSEI